MAVQVPTPLSEKHSDMTRQQRIADGVATPAEAQEYQRILDVLRSKFRAGSLSPENARRFGIE